MCLNIADHTISDDAPVFIVAELSANHNQNFDIAVKTIKAAHKAGADAIKFQTYTPDTLTINCDNPYFRITDGLWKGKTLYQLYKEAYMPWEWQLKLKKMAEEEGLVCFSTPFDVTAVDFLEEMQVPAYKIASFEITDIPLIEYIAAKNKPILLSTGIATLDDITLAVNRCRSTGNNRLALLKCTSAYPAPVEEANLKTLSDLKSIFKTVVGVSDHTTSNTVSVTAVALGAKIIEKHFTLDRKLGGPDASFSLNPEEFSSLVAAIRETEQALGTITYDLSERVIKNRQFARSLFVIKDIKKGEPFTADNIKSIRPGNGLAPKHLSEILGKRAKCTLYAGTPLSWDVIA
jgi:pseudaminic acid synthase